ncbi:hypothetical protein Daesc_003238 [Daldinia eschscholtzii]|uniref:Uncharacterized protein n=1 Tax=Daldinia eschscholtzii TaxID=292717 RepID=A0AAX6MSU8_9PEZI
MTDHWWHVLHNKLYNHAWKYHSFVGTEPNTWEEYLRPVMMEIQALENKDAQSGSPRKAGIAAAIQPGEQQDGNAEANGPSPEDGLNDWLESNKENILENRRPGAVRRNVQRSRTRGALQTRPRRNTVDRLLNLGSRAIDSPRSPVEQEAAQISNILGPMSSWRNRVYRVQKRVRDFLGRASSLFYPAYEVDERQLDALRERIDRRENPLPSPPQPQQQQQKQQHQASEGEQVLYPDLSEQIARLEVATPTNNQAQMVDSNNTRVISTVPQSYTLEQSLGEQQAKALEERLQRLREDDAVAVAVAIDPNPGPQEAVPGRASAQAALTPLSSSPAAGSVPRPFHINQTAHLAPSYIAARLPRRRTPSPLSPHHHHPPPLPPSLPTPPSSSPSPPPAPSRRSSRRTSRNTTTTDAIKHNSSNNQAETTRVKSTPLLWDGAKRTREIWFGVGPGTGRDVGGRKGQGKRV